jgi:SprT protein
MDLHAAEVLANQLLLEFNLTGRWTFGFDRAVRRFGSCNYTKRRISLSKTLTLLNAEDVVHETLLHEIAHALAPRNAGHGPKWKAIAHAIGCNAERCYGDEVVQPQRRYVGRCPTCATTISRNRRKKLSCAKCDRKFNPTHLFVWSASSES